MSVTNEYGQPVGPSLGTWAGATFPPAAPLQGEHVTLLPLDPKEQHQALFNAYEPADDSMWTYMPFGPFDTPKDLDDALAFLVAMDDGRAYAIVAHDCLVGFLSYLRIDAIAGSIEIGAIAFSPKLQRTTAATEAIFLLIKQSFDLGFRRCEWKCDDLNAPSRSAANRLGFSYEGTFRKATNYKGRSRDTAWYSITEDDWPPLHRSFTTWLQQSNFDESGRQRFPLNVAGTTK